MSLPAVSPLPNQSVAVESYARVIPGSAVRAAGQKKGPARVGGRGPQGEVHDPQEWIEAAETGSGTADYPQRVQAILQAMLPRPRAESRWNLWRAVLVDGAVLLAGSLGTARVLGLHLGFSVGFATLYTIVATLLIFSEGGYDSDCRSAAPVTKSVMWAALLTVGCSWLMTDGSPTRVHTLRAAAAGSAGLLALRWCTMHRASIRLRSGSAPVRNVLIVGAGREGRRIAEHLESLPRSGYAVKGFLDDTLLAYPGVLGRIDDLEQVARAHFVDEVMVALPGEPDRSRSIVERARRNRLDVTVVPNLYGSAAGKVQIKNLGSVPMLTLHQEALPAGGLLGKRAFDVVGALGGLVVGWPLMVAIALLIKLDSPGPVCYVAERVGEKGRRFRFYKFRTMRQHSNGQREELRKINQRQGPCFKIAGDPRVTRLGAVLRRYSLDELPQLWNVLLGDMSLVGPRPHPVDDFERYELNHLRRLDMKPGLTGLWQIIARRNPSFHINMALDLEYIERWSFWGDLQILMRTVRVVLAGEGR